jgi:hypothetical protein
MKKLIFAAILMTSAFVASAQTQKGQWLVGGNASFKSEKFGDGDANKAILFQFNPNAGYFFMNNLAGGVRFNYGSTKIKSESDATTNLLVGPFVRYYVIPHADKVNVFVDGSYGWGSTGGHDKANVNGYAFSAGPALFLSPTVALELALSYSSYNYKGTAPWDNTFGVNVGFQIHLGKAKK